MITMKDYKQIDYTLEKIAHRVNDSVSVLLNIPEIEYGSLLRDVETHKTIKFINTLKNKIINTPVVESIEQLESGKNYLIKTHNSFYLLKKIQ